MLIRALAPLVLLLQRRLRPSLLYLLPGDQGKDSGGVSLLPPLSRPRESHRLTQLLLFRIDAIFDQSHGVEDVNEIKMDSRHVEKVDLEHNEK